MAGCLFCNIVDKKIPAEIVLENEHFVAFRDIRTAAPVHALVVPRVHLAGIGEASDPAMLGQIMLAAREVAGRLGLGPNGYRLVINEGGDGGQSVFHLHCHVLGGRSMAWPPG